MTTPRTLDAALNLLAQKERELEDERAVTAALSARCREMKEENILSARMILDLSQQVKALDEHAGHLMNTAARR